MVQDQHEEQKFPAYAKFLCGGLAGIAAALCVYPMGFMKTRMQISGMGGKKKLYNSTVDALKKIIKSEGFFTLYYGASCSVARQALYTTTRLGIYSTLLGLISKDDQPLSFAVKTSMGMFCGLCAGFMATPMDVCMIRMKTDGAKPINEQFKYKHVFNCLIRIGKEDGLKGLFRGGVPTTIRSIVVNGSVLATYSQAKEYLISYGLSEGLLLHAIASLTSGFVTAVISMPVDIIKTRLQAGKGKTSLGKLTFDLLKHEGFLAFWKGLTPYFLRLGPVTILTFIFVEKISYLYSVYILGNKHPKSNL